MNKYKAKSYEEAMIIKAALCTKYPNAADTINEVFKLSDDGWVDTITEDKEILVLNGWQSGAPAEWTINFDGDIVDCYNAEKDVDNIDENMEGNTMMNNNGTINEDTINNGTNGGNDMNNEAEKISAAEKAGEFVNATKDKVVEGAKKFAEDLSTIKDEAIKINKMNNADAQVYITNKGVKILNNIKDEGNKFLGKLNILSDKNENPKVKAKLKEKATSLADFIEIINETLDNDDINGWGKFVEILKAVAKLILGLIIKGAAIALKIGIALVVGGIKVGATGVVLAIELAKVIKNDIIKPAYDATGDAWNVHKKYKNARKTKDNLDNDFDDEFDDEEFYDEFDDMVEEAATVN